MGREKIFNYDYDDNFYEMIPSSQSQASLQDIQWTNKFASSVSITEPKMDEEEIRGRLWNDDFGHRPSWCDAKLALIQIKNGRAKGNVPALYVRRYLQAVLFRLGCFIQKHNLFVVLFGVTILSLFAIGLKDSVIETDMEKLWVEKRGRLNEEREYVTHSFKINDLLAMSQNGSSQDEDTSGALLGGSGTEQFLMLIQTPNQQQAKVVKKDFLLHEEVLMSVAQLKIKLFNETWGLRDICFRPPTPDLAESFKALVGELLDQSIPCVIISPLDCFWEGAKANGPFPPYKIEGLLSLLESFTHEHVTWKTLDPLSILDEVNQIVQGSTIQSIRSLFERAGIRRGYVERPCLEPLDPECPEKAPNHFDICSLVPAVLEYNSENGNLFKLIEEAENSSKYEVTTPFEPFEGLTECEIYGEKIRRLLLGDEKLYEKFVPASSAVEINKKLSQGCNGFAENYMRWPNDLIIGGAKKEGNEILSFEALESVFMLASSIDVFQRTNLTAKKNLDRPWSLYAADQILAAWQRHYTNFIYNHEKNNENLRIFHPLAGTSVGDMMEEFSKFNPTVIIIGYIFMIFYASLSLCSFSDKGVRSGVGLGLAGCLLVTLAGVAGLGCSMLIGVPFNAATTQIVPFLTLGLGVDDMFLLVHNYRDVVKLAKRDEIGFLLKETGLSALLTSVNNVLAFLAGGLMPVPALRDFCLQVALLLTFNAISILTIYPAIMTFDLRRRKSRRVDLFCCIRTSQAADVKKVAPVVNAGKPPLRSVTCATELADRAVMAAGDTNVGRLGPAAIATKGGGVAIGVPRSAGNGYSHSRVNSDIVGAGGDASAVLDNSIGARSTSRSFLTAANGGPAAFNDDGNSLAHGASGDPSVDASAAYDCSPGHWTLHRFVGDYYNRWLAMTPVKIGVICFNLVILVLGAIFCSKVTLGLELTDVIPKGTAAFAFLEARQSYFSFYPFNAIIQGPIDLPNKQILLDEYRRSLSDVGYVIKREGKVQEQFWLDLMRNFLLNLQQHLDRDMADGKIRLDPETLTGVDSGATGESLLAFQLLCNVGSMLDCSRVNTTKLVDNQTGLIEQTGFYNYLTAWFNVDPMTYYVSRAAMVPIPPVWSRTFLINDTDYLPVPAAENLTFSRIPFFLNGLIDTPAIVDMIQHVRSVCDEYTAKGLPNFPEGIPFTFWEQYLNLRWNLFVALLIVIGSVFVVISVLLVSPWTSAVISFVLVVLVVELAGFMGAADLKLNAVSAVSLITAVGIGVEFTVHLSLSFLTNLGTRNQRMAATLSHMFIPVMHGGLSTLLGVVMLAFSEFEFIVRYFFLVLSALIVLGLLNGLVLLPVLLSLVGPCSDVTTVDGSHYLPPPSPAPVTKKPQQKFKNVEVF